MIHRRAILLLLLVPSSLAAGEPMGLRSARARLLEGDYNAAVVKYSRVRLAQDPALCAEYAYALALAGMKDLALGHLDQALYLQADRPEKDGVANFFAARAYAALGRDDLARELTGQASPRPAWLTRDLSAARQENDHPLAEDADILAANALLMDKRFYTAEDRFRRLAIARPQESLVQSGWAIALEKIGAYRAAAAAARRSLALRGDKMKPEARAVYESHIHELESRPALPPRSTPLQRAGQSLKGRYLAFLGGNVNRSPNNTVTNMNGRLGKFFTDRMDASLTAGYTGGNIPDKFRGLSLGVSGRYHQPLPVPAPINATMGGRVEYNPRPRAKTSLIISPGLSWLTDNGSVDLFLDYGLSGPLKKTRALSLGYTFYFKAAR